MGLLDGWCKRDHRNNELIKIKPIFSKIKKKDIIYIL